jgi:hypothetical protein
MPLPEDTEDLRNLHVDDQDEDILEERRLGLEVGRVGGREEGRARGRKGGRGQDDFHTETSQILASSTF